MPMTYDQYQNKRSWLIDTAETAADQKRLKAQLAKLDAMYKAQKATPKMTPKPTMKATPKPKPTSKKVSNGSDTKPYNVKLMTPKELVGGKEKNKVKETIKSVTGKVKAAAGVMPTATKKTQTKSPMKPGTNPKIGAKAKELTGPAAIKAIQDRTSPAGVKKAEAAAKKAIAKKYPGLTKKSK